MKDNLPDKAAIVQRDRETYAIAPHLPAGVVDPATLRKIADVAEKYGAAALKVTSAQRIAIVGLKDEDLDNVWADLGIKPGSRCRALRKKCKNLSGNNFLQAGKARFPGAGSETRCKISWNAHAFQAKNGCFRLSELLCRASNQGYRDNGHSKRIYPDGRGFCSCCT